MIKLKSLLAAGFLLLSTSANAALINFTGDIEYHNDVIQIAFTLDSDATNVRIWTDSFLDGTNFDPITALWDASGNLIEQDDDNASINPATQTRYDSGFSLPSLVAGDYYFTVATFNNFANGTRLVDGFNFDSETAIALADWSQPSNGLGMGSFWSVWLDGVSSATPPPSIPEPNTVLLMGLGLMMSIYGRRRKQ